MTPRALVPADLDAIDALRPADWNPYRATFEHYFRQSCCRPFGLESGGRLAAMGTLIVFGSTAWIAQLITHPDERGKGLASSLLAFLLAEAHRSAVTTVSLVATDAGFPLYVRSGFRVEGEYLPWTRPDAAPHLPEASPGLRAWSPADSAVLWDLDRAASGEDRRGYTVGRTSGWVAAERGKPDGFFCPELGEGLVVARTADAGRRLLHRRLDGALRAVIPTENEAAVAVLQERGFQAGSPIRRMSLGKPLQRDPKWVWSRIAGNLG